ncbi:unnamed protein product [Rotaria sp. Silwood1]|nr:unnamed protein product [Rotaria sp. Silwood1]
MWNQSPDNDISSDLSTLVDDLTHLDLQKSSLCSTTTTITSPTTSVASSAEVEVDEATTLLNSISSYFFIKPTKYGGRGCFANSDLAQGTIVHECSMPLSSTIARPFRKELSSSVSLSSLELEIFQLLQSNDIEKICKYPYLLHSYTNKIYKFLKISTLEKLQPYIIPSIIRSIIGKNLTNIYGIWSIDDEPDGNKEFFGYSLYPSASFFNHSCNPNLINIEKGAKIIFKLLKNIKKMKNYV